LGQIKFSFLLFCCKAQQGREIHEWPERGVPPALSVLVLKAEPTPELSCSSPSTRQRCHPLSSHCTVQTTASLPCGLPLPGWQAGHGRPRLHASSVALLLQLEECKLPELLLRIGQEKSSNSNRKSKCPLQTCTRYEAIQRKEKNQTLDDGDYIMLWINL